MVVVGPAKSPVSVDAAVAAVEDDSADPDASLKRTDFPNESPAEAVDALAGVDEMPNEKPAEVAPNHT